MSFVERIEAYAEVAEWTAGAEWGPGAMLATGQQFEAYVEKCVELGLPVRALKVVGRE